MNDTNRPPCRCSCSTGIHDGLTFGRGTLDDLGFWSRPCWECARWAEQKDGVPRNTYWPFEQRQLTPSELVARLRDYDMCSDVDVDDAADLIEQMQHERAVLRDAQPLFERGWHLCVTVFANTGPRWYMSRGGVTPGYFATPEEAIASASQHGVARADQGG